MIASFTLVVAAVADMDIAFASAVNALAAYVPPLLILRFGIEQTTKKVKKR